MPAADRPNAFFSGPFEPEQVRRLTSLIDEQLRLRAALRSAAASRVEASLAADGEPSEEAGWLDPTMTFSGESLRGLAAPLFNLNKGGRIARVGKAVLNLPLRILGTPQRHFNETVRRVVSSWSELLDATLDNLAALQREVAAQREQLRALLERLPELGTTLEEMASRLTRAERRLAGLGGTPREATAPARVDARERHRLSRATPEGLRVNLGRSSMAGYVNVGLRPGPGVDVLADVRRLPFASASSAELFCSRVVNEFHPSELVRNVLPSWLALLRPDGRLRIVCPNWQAALERHGAGMLSLEHLHDITFGPREDARDAHRAMYTPATLVPLLEQAGFVGCSVTLEERDRHGCPEMEVVAYRPRA